MMNKQNDDFFYDVLDVVEKNKHLKNDDIITIVSKEFSLKKIEAEKWIDSVVSYIEQSNTFYN